MTSKKKKPSTTDKVEKPKAVQLITTKVEKLELLLNKVVEFNQPNVAYYKGFLYKDGNQYYIKVVESTLGSFFYNDKIYLYEGQEQYIIQAEKPKLMRVSLKSWHYRLIKYVLGVFAPTPKTMQNGCPYFWLLIFSLFACVFVTLWHILCFAASVVPMFLYWCLEKSTNIWIDGVEESEAFEYYENGRRKSNDFKFPLTTKLYLDKMDGDFLQKFILEKYGLDINNNPKEYSDKRVELKTKWDTWRKERDDKRLVMDNIRWAKDREARLKEIEHERLHELRKEKWNARMKPIVDGFNKLIDSIEKMFTYEPAKLKLIIKRTKQIAGVVISVIILAFMFLTVNVLSLVLTYAIDNGIKFWYLFASIGALAVVGGIFYVLYIFFTGWAQSIINKYHGGKRVWYIEPFIYGIYYPLKYIVLGIAYGVFYVILTPIKFIFYNLLWKIVLVNTGKFLWNLLCMFGHGVGSSTGIFGEYFSASYTDYCPGIEWVNSEEE